MNCLFCMTFNPHLNLGLSIIGQDQLVNHVSFAIFASDLCMLWNLATSLLGT